MKQKYSLMMAINLVVGVVIGSGIFFKIDNIIYDTQGSLFWGSFAFLIVGISVLFGAKVISLYASTFDVEGGMVAYGQHAFNERFGFIVAWFFIAIYFPGLIVALGLSFSSYMSSLISINFLDQICITFWAIAFSYYINVTRPNMSGVLSSVTTYLKLIPLIFIFVFGLLFTKQVPTEATLITQDSAPSMTNALISIAFAFDGWIIATSISNEIQDSKRNLSRALLYGIIIIFIAYFGFYLGVLHIFDPETSMYLGDSLIYNISNSLIGTLGATIITSFILISIFGAMHGTILAYIRLPKAMLKSKELKPIGNFSITFQNNLYCIGFIIFYLLLQLTASIPNTYLNEISFDVSSIPVIIAYIFYVLLYFGTIKLIRENNLSKVNYIYILIASLSSVMIIISSLSDNGLLYILISLIIIFIGQLLYKSSN